MSDDTEKSRKGLRKIEEIIYDGSNDWLKDTFSDIGTAFTVAEYFARYVKKRWPEANGSQINALKGCFFVEYIDVIFEPPEKRPRRLVRVAYSSDTLIVYEPDLDEYNDTIRDLIRDKHQLRYANVVKEGHQRVNALLWQTFSQEEQDNIIKMFPENEEAHKQILAEIEKEIRQEAEKVRQQKERGKSDNENS